MSSSNCVISAKLFIDVMIKRINDPLENINGMQFLETSAKMNTNVKEAFEALGKLMIEFNTEKKSVSASNDKRVLSASSGKDIKTKKKCC